MIKIISNINQVMDLLDNEKCTFYYGKTNDKPEITRDEIRVMEPNKVNQLIKNKLIAIIRR